MPSLDPYAPTSLLFLFPPRLDGQIQGLLIKTLSSQELQLLHAYDINNVELSELNWDLDLFAKSSVISLLKIRISKLDGTNLCLPCPSHFNSFHVYRAGDFFTYQTASFLHSIITS